MSLDDKISTTPPEGYDKALWESIPSVRTQLYPGKHDLYIYGQGSADGMACIKCNWQVSEIFLKIDAIIIHDTQMGLEHDCLKWIPNRDNQCPCGKIQGATNPGSMALREFSSKLKNDYALDFSSTEALFEQINHLLIRDAELMEE